MMKNIKDITDLGLPCYENAQRLVRVETCLEGIAKKLDELIDHPCSRCRHQDTVTRLTTEMRAVRWVGSILGAGFLGTLIERILQ